MDLIYFLNVLYRRKWIILGLSFIAIVAAMLFKMNKRPLYESVAQYSTGFTSQKVTMVDGSPTIDIYGAGIKFNNVIETFKSPRVVSRISYRLLLHDIQNPDKPYRKLTGKEASDPLLKMVHKDSVVKILASKLVSGDMLHSEIEKERLILEYLKLYRYDHYSILESINIRRVDQTDYLDIVCWSESPELSSWIVNAMGDEFLNFYRGLNTQRSEENAASIESILESQQKKVDSMGQSLLAEKMTQGTIDPVSRSTSAMETVREIETRLAEEKSKKNLSQSRLAYLTQRVKDLEAISSGGSADDVIRLTNRKNDLLAEISRKGGNDPVLQKELDDVRAEIRKKSGSGASSKKAAEEIGTLQNQISEERALLKATETTIADYESSIRRYMGLTNVNPGSSVKMDVLRDQLEIENNQLKNIKEKFSQVQGLVKDDPTSNFIQTRIGQPAIDPESKKTMLTMMLAGVSMFFLSSVIFLFIEIFDSSVKTPTIFKKHVKIKVANVLNKINLKKTSVAGVILNEHVGKKFNAENIFKNNIRKLRHEVINSGQQIFLLTSTHKKAGKSTVIEALASSLLLSKKRVLMIDLNFTNNTLTQRFNATSFIQDIAEKVDYNRSFVEQQLATPTEHEGLYVIGCSGGNYTPAEALYNIDMPAFFRQLKNEFDFIFIEGAALNNYSDSKELTQYAERIFTVFSAEDSVTHVSNESLRFVSTLGEKNQGIVLNEVRTENINS